MSRVIAVCVCLGLAVASSHAAELDSALKGDGWYSWRVAAIDPAPGWCCMDWRSGSGRPQACNLDRGDHGFSNDHRQSNTTGNMQVYARIQGGAASDILTLSPQCPIVSTAAVNDLGMVAVPESMRWLAQHIAGDRDLSSSALAAIATHRGDMATTILVDTAQDATDQEVRHDAIFWMGQLRVNETAAQLESFMFDDPSSELREHAAFSYSQSTADNRAALLIRQGREDRSAEVRGQAWFWLAQTGLAGAETAITRAMLEDESSDVRDEAVFALSQLPDERAVNSLIGIVENRAMQRELREQALFWLAQSDSDEAFEKIEQLLAQER